MGVYPVVLFAHVLAVLVAAMAGALTLFAELQLRRATSPDEVIRWGRLVHSVVPAFPVATVTLLGTGAYMTQAQWSWHTGWIDAGLVGLALIVASGSGIEASRVGCSNAS